MSENAKLDPATLSAEDIHAATAKILADPLLHRFYDWSVKSSRALFAPATEKVHGSAFPVGNCKVCGELVAPYNKHAKYEGGYTCQPAQPEPAATEMPVSLDECIRRACERLRDQSDYGRSYTADDLERAWRTHSQPVAVGMTEELRLLLEKVDDAVTYRLQHGSLEEAHILTELAAAVRQQAAQGRKVELPKVREILNRLWSASGPEISDDQITAALAELDAVEGKK